jgi:hypothetical protein
MLIVKQTSGRDSMGIFWLLIQQEYRTVQILVYKKNGFLGALNQVTAKSISIKNLIVEEDAFLRTLYNITTPCSVYEKEESCPCIPAP